MKEKAMQLVISRIAGKCLMIAIITNIISTTGMEKILGEWSEALDPRLTPTLTWHKYV